MDLSAPIILVLSLLLFGQSLFTIYLMLYSWERPEREEKSRGPTIFRAPRTKFTIVLPARHEEAVIADTIRSIWASNYPHRMMEIIVVCHSDDEGTIAEARRAIKQLRVTRSIRVETFDDPPINKPHGLNVALLRSKHAVVTIFDAEDDVHPDVFNIVNTIMLDEGVGIVQSGVQLMNYRDRWFTIHNCLEYFFWFKSRLHFHAAVGMIPLGGNTVFMRRDLIERVGGWDEDCLTEDADIGLRMSLLGEPIRVVYDAKYVTREETPDSIASLIRQRTRWNQGFLQVLRKGTWLQLPGLGRRLLALYTFSSPLVQMALMMLWPLVLIGSLFLKVPLLVAMVAFLPLYGMVFQFALTMVGAFIFTREYGVRLPIAMPLVMTVTWLPYQWILGWAALRAGYRELNIHTNWEKTAHSGAHRRVAGQQLPWRARVRRLVTDAPAWAARLGVRAIGHVSGLAMALGRASLSPALARASWSENSDELGSATPSAPSAMAIRATMSPPSATEPAAAPRPPLPPISPALGTCPACGAVSRNPARFCRRCGSSISDLMASR
jgi:cellulose synthase/poly-beta-1,6-N-acetylglucosamine synthase-like glycosyltransferase